MIKENNNEIVFCLCGCGIDFNKYDSRHRIRRYIQGHNPQNRPKGIIPWNKGKKLGFTPKMAFKKGHKTWIKGKKIDRNKHPNFGHFQKHSEQTKKMFSETRIGKKTGKDSPSWKGGITPIHAKIRNSIEYADWRKAVFVRDNWTCVDCKAVGVMLHADHIKPFCSYPELRLDVNNGRTLCVSCHRKTDTWGGRAVKSYNRDLLIMRSPANI